MDAVDHPNFHSSQQGSESFPSTSLGSAHIAQALERSSDDGATLMFSKMNLSDIGVAAAEELASLGRDSSEDESPLKRIAFGNNRLTTLPTEFALLSQLRYLNLKRNSFSVFPDVLTLMPSLDTLDISHNKITKLPFHAGHLVHLRVFSLSRNKIVRLPRYLSQFTNLEVLQVERNPIQWPPKIVMDAAGILESRQAMKNWVRGLQQWIEAGSRVPIRDHSGYNEQHDLDTYIEESYNSWKFPLKEKTSGDFTPHNRTLSVDSSFSASSTSESLQEVEIPNPLRNESDRPPPLHLGILGTFSAENSPTRVLDNYLPSPVDSEFLDDGSNPISLEHQRHVRNASYSSGSHSSYSKLLGKKSMPDLRTAKLNFNKKDAVGLDFSPSSNTVASRETNNYNPLPSHGLDSDSSLTSATPRETNQLSPTRKISSMTFERNSYFQRLSTLPTSSALPQPLICLVESARSILFAMCQVYQTLEHFIAHAIDDRISSVLRKVLDPASTDMTQLINSLERFDATSRKTLPSPAVCRGVLESCRDTVAVFGKAVGVLALQLQVIVTGDDVRYSRWILLELYGATVEVASAWESMVPHIEAIRPLLHSKPFAGPAPPLLVNSSGTEVYSASPTSLVPASIDPFPFLSSMRSQTGPSGAPMNGGIRTARRHAGSFSSKDVEIGKKLPSYDDVPGLFGGVVAGTAKQIPTLRAPKRQGTIPITTISSPSPTTTASSSIATPSSSSAIGDTSHPVHSRQSSQASFQTSASSSPSAPSKTHFLDLPSNSRSQVDKEALQAVQDAVDVAPAVWDMIKKLVDGTSDTKPWVHDTIEKARAVTLRLSETLKVMQDTDAFSDRSDLREDAHAFLKIVVQLSNVIKMHRGPHPVSSTLRNGMVKLTNSTEEFAILLHVSSFSPSTSRPYTPLITGPDELRLGSSLSRSKSAQHSGSFRLPILVHDGPRSALPSQSFKLPAVRRLRSREGAGSPIPDPG
ncbi:hypothetical protein C0991_004206 [Blastosporella zonata]|nr:hypothetical protein C0991_004206 [Blastosporella zonata]